MMMMMQPSTPDEKEPQRERDEQQRRARLEAGEPTGGEVPSDRLWDVFWQAAEIENEEDRAAWVDNECSGDEQLHRQVRAMLRVHQSAPEFMETPAALAAEELLSDSLIEGVDGIDTPRRHPTTIRMPERIGKFSISRMIGYGGMGVVYEARQERPARTVALKIIRPEVTTPEHVRRFEYEADILGRLKHPGIAQVYEAGAEETEYGPQPYFAMELIDGQPLMEFARERELDDRQRLELIVRTCEAVHHAHQQGVIHRDLKPANILITPDADPKILDFGVARLAGSDVEMMTQATEHGQLLGTLPYMSPEQVSGGQNEVDIRSDVYALGVLMYELLTGRLPYQIVDRMMFEAMQVIREQPPQPLSSINRTYRGDIETIVGKALQKDKRDRYQSAAEFAADISRHLNNELIEARPATTIEQAVKFARRNRELVGGVAASFLLIVLGLIGTLWMARQAAAERDDAQRAEQVANEQRTEAEVARAEAEFQAYTADLAAASAELELERPRLARQRLERSPDHLRDWEWAYLMRRTDDSIARPVNLPDHRIHDIELLPDRSAYALLMTSSEPENPGSEVQVRDAQSHEVLHAAPASISVRSAEILASDVTSSLLATLGPSGAIRVYSMADWTVAAEFEVEAANVEHLQFTGDGSRLIVATTPVQQSVLGSDIRAWSTADWVEDPQWRRRLPWMYTCTLSPDAQHLLSGGDTDVTVQNLITGESVNHTNAHRLRLHRIRFSDDGSRVVTCGFDGMARVWTFPEWQMVHEFGPFAEYVLDAKFLGRDQSKIGLAIADGSVRIGNLQTGVEEHVLHGHESSTVALAEHWEDDLLWTASDDGTVRQWQPQRNSAPRVIETGMPYQYDTKFIPGTDIIALIGGEPDLHLYNFITGQRIGRLPGHEYEIGGIDFDRQHDRIVTGSNDGTIRVWDRRTLDEIDVPVQTDTHLVATLAVDPGGTRVAAALIGSRRFIVASLDGVNRLGDTAYRVLEDAPGQPTAIAFNSDGSLVASGGDDGIVRVWNPADGELVFALEGAQSAVLDVVFVNDDTALLASTRRGRLYRWSLADPNAQPWSVVAHASAANQIAVHPSGSRFITSSADGTIKVWHMERGEELLTLRDHEAFVFAANFSDDGRTLISSSFDGTIRTWSTEPLSELYQLQIAHNEAMAMIEREPVEALVGNQDGSIGAWVDEVVNADNTWQSERRRRALQAAATTTLYAHKVAEKQRLMAAAMPLVNEYRRQWITPEASAAEIRKATEITAAVREYAARQAVLRGSHPMMIYQACLGVLASSDMLEEQYEVVREVGASWRKPENDPAAITAFTAVEAAALVRLKQFEAAIQLYASLDSDHAGEIEAQATPSVMNTADLAFYAMALQALDREDDAQEMLNRAKRQVQGVTDPAMQQYSRVIIAEAVSVIGASSAEQQASDADGQ